MSMSGWVGTGPEAKTDRFVIAKNAELEQWKTLKVYDVVPFTGQKLIDPRWVLTNKVVLGEKEMKAKARLCVKGCFSTTGTFRSYMKYETPPRNEYNKIYNKMINAYS